MRLKCLCLTLQWNSSNPPKETSEILFHTQSGMKDSTWHARIKDTSNIWDKKQQNLQLLDILACNSANKQRGLSCGQENGASEALCFFHSVYFTFFFVRISVTHERNYNPISMPIPCILSKLVIFLWEWQRVYEVTMGHDDPSGLFWFCGRSVVVLSHPS